MAFSMFFFASPRFSAGEPESLGCEAEDKPRVVKLGRNAISEVLYSSVIESI
jgi:hypothetical protein